MKLGLQLNSFAWTGGPERFGRTLADIGRFAEEAGFDRIGVADHLWQHPIMGGPPDHERRAGRRPGPGGRGPQRGRQPANGPRARGARGLGQRGDVVARELYLSEGTVRNYLSTAIKKLEARNRVEAARLAERKGWL